MANKTKSKSTFAVRTFSGLNEKRFERKGGGEHWGKRIKLSDEPTAFQFLTGPEGFVEFDRHVWREDGKWHFVPCIGDDCPLCASEDSNISKVSYCFVANVYSFDDKAVKILEGGRDIATRVAYRFKRSKTEAKFLKKTYEITKLDTQPVSYDLQIGEEPPIQTTKLTLEDLQAYVNATAAEYFGQGGGKSSLQAKSDDDDLDNDAEGDDKPKKSKGKKGSGFDEKKLRGELEELTPKKLAKRAADVGVKEKKIKKADGDDDKLIELIVGAVKDGAAPWDGAADDEKKSKPAAKKAPSRKPRK